jgi:hypothetical protein
MLAYLCPSRFSHPIVRATKKITQNNNQGFEKKIAARTKQHPMTIRAVGDFSFEDDRRISARSTLIGPQNVADRDYRGLLLVVTMST